MVKIGGELTKENTELITITMEPNLPKQRRERLEAAKDELRALFGRKRGHA